MCEDFTTTKCRSTKDDVNINYVIRKQLIDKLRGRYDTRGTSVPGRTSDEVGGVDRVTVGDGPVVIYRHRIYCRLLTYRLLDKPKLTDP